MSGSPESIPWRRVVSLLRPLRAGLAAMVGLSVLGSLAGLVPPITLGYLINDLVERHGVKPEDALWAGLLAGAIVVEAAAYIGSDGLYARNSGRLYRNLRLRMFDSVMRRPASERADSEGLPSRFISDVETFERVTIYALDTGSMLVVELATALIVLGLMEPWAILVVVPLLAATWLVTRRMQEPAASAGQQRQEQLEELTGTLTRELGRNRRPGRRAPASRPWPSGCCARRCTSAGCRPPTCTSPGALAKLGPIAVVIAAASAGSYHAGTLLTLYLLAARCVLRLRRPRRPQPRHAISPRRHQPLSRTHRPLTTEHPNQRQQADSRPDRKEAQTRDPSSPYPSQEPLTARRTASTSTPRTPTPPRPPAHPVTAVSRFSPSEHTPANAEQPSSSMTHSENSTPSSATTTSNPPGLRSRS